MTFGSRKQISGYSLKKGSSCDSKMKISRSPGVRTCGAAGEWERSGVWVCDVRAERAKCDLSPRVLSRAVGLTTNTRPPVALCSFVIQVNPR